MSEQNLGRLVKWIGTDGGWKTGREVLGINGQDPVCQVRYSTPGNVPVADDAGKQFMVLVQEDCDGNLSWVENSQLQPHPMRSDWEDKPLLSKD